MKPRTQAYWVFAMVAFSFLLEPGRFSPVRIILAVVGIALGVLLLQQGRAKT